MNNRAHNNSILTLWKQILTLSLLLFFIPSVFAQLDSIPQKNKIILKWTPTSLMGSPSALQFAGEFFYNNRHSIQLEYGVMFPEISIRNKFDRGQRIRVEHRFYTKKERWYLAPEIHFAYMKYTTDKSFSDNWLVDSISGEKYTFDTYKETVGVRKLRAGLTFKVGFQYIFKKPKIVLDVYAGIGLRFVNTVFTSYPTSGEYVTPIDNWLEPPFKEGNRLGPDAIVGFKVGYQIR